MPISNKHELIFIHIPKCAGSSIERAINADIRGYSKPNYRKLYGWDPINKVYMHHLTPQELIDKNYISKKKWDEYYKVVIVRNSWDKVISDLKWFIKRGVKVNCFEDYINGRGVFDDIFNNKNSFNYRGEHIRSQLDYFYLNDEIIKYDKVIRFNNIDEELLDVCNDLNLKPDFFKFRINANSRKEHYSHYFTDEMLEMVYQKYKLDIDFFKFHFEDKREPEEKVETFKINELISYKPETKKIAFPKKVRNKIKYEIRKIRYFFE